jgi:hypothetical protein
MSEPAEVAKAAEAILQSDPVATAVLEQFLSSPTTGAEPVPVATPVVAPDESPMMKRFVVMSVKTPPEEPPKEQDLPALIMKKDEEVSAELKPTGIRILVRPKGKSSFNVVPHVAECDRALNLARFILAAETGESLSMIQTALTHWAETTKSQEPGRVTLIIDPHAPAYPTRYCSKDREPYFVGRLEEKRPADAEAIDVLAPFHRPVGEGGVRAVLSVLRETLDLLMYDDEDKTAVGKYTDPRFNPCDVLLLTETVAMKTALTSEEHKVMEGMAAPVPALEDERRALLFQQHQVAQRLRASLQEAGGAARKLDEEETKKSPLGRELIALSQKIGKIESKIDTIREGLRSHIESSYIARSRSGVLSFFEPKNYELVRTEPFGVADLGRDTIFFARAGKEPNPLLAVTHFAAMMAPDQLVFRIVYFGEQDWSDLLRPLTRAEAKAHGLLPEKDTEEDAAPPIAVIDRARYEPEALFARLVDVKREAFAHYQSEYANLVERNEKKKKEAEAAAASKPELATTGFTADAGEKTTAAVEKEDAKKEEEPNGIRPFRDHGLPTIVHFTFPKLLFAEFFQSIHILRADHHLARRQEMRKKMESEQQMVSPAPQPSAAEATS